MSSLILFFEISSLTEPKFLVCQDWLASKIKGFPVSESPVLAAMPRFYMGAGDLNSDPQ